MYNDSQKTAQEIALFVFIPFCKIKCTYCDFNAYANLNREMPSYARAVSREVGLASDGPARGMQAKSLYFGGGTPSVVPARDLELIVDACHETVAFEPSAEVTLEANPGTLDLDKLITLKSLGINRLSLGVQSFSESTVRRLNRGHTATQVVETYDLARRAGFDNISFDFIFGLPLQTMEEWRSTLEQAIALGPEHLSLYALKVEEGTGLEHQIKRGKYVIPDDELAAEMYEVAEEMLDGASYQHYEISNWARPKFESRHNLTYWHEEPYLGFGAGAHSFHNNERFWNVLSPVEYIRLIESGMPVRAGQEVIGGDLEAAEPMIFGLRLGKGVDFVRFRERFGLHAEERFLPALRDTQAMGLTELTAEHVVLTARGRLLSNQVFWRLLPD